MGLVRNQENASALWVLWQFFSSQLDRRERVVTRFFVEIFIALEMDENKRIQTTPSDRKKRMDLWCPLWAQLHWVHRRCSLFFDHKTIWSTARSTLHCFFCHWCHLKTNKKHVSPFFNSFFSSVCRKTSFESVFSCLFHDFSSFFVFFAFCMKTECSNYLPTIFS